jgi:hypothetical protein
MYDTRACHDCGTAVGRSAFVVRRTQTRAQAWCHDCWTLRGIARATLGLPDFDTVPAVPSFDGLRWSTPPR